MGIWNGLRSLQFALMDEPCMRKAVVYLVVARTKNIRAKIFRAAMRASFFIAIDGSGYQVQSAILLCTQRGAWQWHYHLPMDLMRRIAPMKCSSQFCSTSCGGNTGATVWLSRFDARLQIVLPHPFRTSSGIQEP
jgi:hypothetical protein